MRLLGSLSFRLAVTYAVLFTLSVLLLGGLYYAIAIRGPMESVRAGLREESAQLAAVYRTGGAGTLAQRLERRAGEPSPRAAYHALIDPADAPEEFSSVEALTQWYNDALAKRIRQQPEQYWWLHDRWKEVPAAKRKKRIRPAAAAAPRRPKRASASSDCPLPSTPASPTISPGLTTSDSPRTAVRPPSPFTTRSRTTSPGWF